MAIGLSRKAGVYIWADGSPCTEDDKKRLRISYPEIPQRRAAAEEQRNSTCAVLHIRNGYYLMDYQCDQPRFAVCQKPQTEG